MFSVEGWSCLPFVSVSSDDELLITDHRNQTLLPFTGSRTKFPEFTFNSREKDGHPEMAEIEYFPPEVTGS